MNRKIFGGLTICLALCGCGTIDNLSGDHAARVYGGVRADVKQVAQSTGEVFRGDSAGGVALSAGTGALCALDTPLSAVADTATLPVVVVRKLRSRAD